MKTNYSSIMRTALSSLFAALQTRPQLFKERIVISYPADIIAVQRTTYLDLHHFEAWIYRVIQPGAIQRIKLISTSR